MNAKHILSAAATAAALFAAAPAWATITFVDNPGNLCMLAGQPGGCEENIQFEQQATVGNTTTVTGDTNQTGQPVIFDTVFAKPSASLGGAGTGQNIAADGLGQANIVCSPGATACLDNSPPPGFDSQLTSLEMKPGNNTAWTDALINLDSGVGDANIFVTDNFGNNFDDPLGNGQNFLGIIASAGEVITDIQITQVAADAGAQFGWNDFKQPRVSGVCTLQGTTCDAVDAPEPTSLALLGSALGGLGLLWRRRRSRV